MKRFVIFDIDGTLADNQWRSVVYRNNSGYPATRSDYEQYLAGIPKDKPIVPVLELCQYFLDKKHVFKTFFFTGRYEEERTLTFEWLKSYVWPAISNDILFMRPESFGEPDIMNDAGWKLKWARDVTGQRLQDIFCVFDDRNYVVDAWRAAGVYCIQPQEGDF